jgi:hypothetical protein
MIDELESIWKKVVVAKFKILSHNWHGKNEENRIKPQSG